MKFVAAVASVFLFSLLAINFAAAQSCTDSDNGINITVYGNVQGNYTGKESYSLADSCITLNSVSEYYCMDSSPASTNRSCAAGTACIQGACRVALTTSKNPTSCSGQWSNCNRAYTSDNLTATATATSLTTPIKGTWRGFSFSIPTGNTVTRATVKLKAKATNTNAELNLRFKKNGTTTYLVANPSSYPLSTNWQTLAYEINTSGLQAADFGAYFTVEVGAIRETLENPPNVSLDEIKTEVTYVPAPANSGSVPAQGLSGGNIFERLLDRIFTRIFGV